MLVKLIIISKLGLRNITKGIKSLIFLNIYTPPQHALTHIIIFPSKYLIKLTLNSTQKLRKLYILIGENLTSRFNKIIYLSLIPSSLFCFLFVCLFVFAFLFDLLCLLSLTLIIGIFYCLSYTLLLLHLIKRHLVSQFSLSSIVLSILALIIGIFYCLDCISLL